MYIKVRDIVPKCTERSEGILIFNECLCSIGSTEYISIDFDGIQNVTDDFVIAFLGQLAGKDKTAINRIQYVRVQTYIKTKFKRATKQIVAIH